MRRICITVLIVALISVCFSCTKKTAKKPTSSSKAKKTTPTVKKSEKESSHFGFMPAGFDYKNGKEAGGNWDRPFFELFEWGLLEPEPETFDFSLTDQYVKKAQEYGFNTLACIQPFASWDQEANLGKFPQVDSPNPRGTKTRAKPSDMKAYRNFVKELVERYDGDGQDDMPGLKYPIKYWEVANEPEMQEPPLIFFQGPPQDYFEVLKSTYEAVKSADSDAKVLNGGMAGMKDFMTEYWQEVLDLGGGDYFDIANMHSIGHGEPLNIPEFRDFLSKNNLSKPIWVTEVQIEDRQDKKSEEYYAQSLARSYIFALANGVDKFFYVNLRLPERGLPAEGEGGPGFSDLSTLISEEGQKQPLFYAHQTIEEKLDQPISVEKIKEDVEPAVSDGHSGSRKVLVGQYKFKLGDKTVYALWGTGETPAEISGKIKVTYLDGEEKEMNASELSLTENPVFVEKL